MIIQTKYMSQCPVCRMVIAKGTRVDWIKGQPLTHIECMSKTPEEIMETMPKNFTVSFLREEDNYFFFKAIRKDKKELEWKYTKYGAKVFSDGKIIYL